MADLLLRSDKFDSMEVTAPTAGYTKGDMVAVESVIGVIVDTKTVGLKTNLIYRCPKIVVAKVAGTGKTIAAGAKVYFKSASKAVTGDSTGNTLCGRALVAASAVDTTVEIDLDGAAVA